MNKKTKLLFLMLCFITTVLTAQNSITGTVKDSDGSPLIGAAVVEVGSDRGSITDVDGNFRLDANQIPTTLSISYLGFKTQELAVSAAGSLSIVLEEISSKLDEIVVVGTRGKERTILTSPVPIDNINAADLISSGQTTVDQMINYKVPSYNSTNQTISDATAHFDPSELRNMGPSRTLVLVNGKRKNQSALVYVNDTPGKGEVGTDMKSIPSSAIERIEVLRDGASAQYGSDAIAGVINIVLKNREEGVVTAGAGITTEGDGLMYEASVNKGFKIGENGNLNLTADFYHQDETNRAGEPGGDGLFGVIFQPNPDDVTNGTMTQEEFDAAQAFANSVLNGTHPWLVENPDMGMTVGQPAYDKFSIFGNLGMPYGDNKGEFYLFGGYTFRDGKSFALYRAPYWITDDFGLLTPSGETYDGFQPTFETSINDLTFTVGNRYNFSGWNTDISVGYGSNSVDYLIGNTINVALGANSPTEFDAGAYAFGNLVGNIDVSKAFDDISLNFGVEARQENFKVTAGQEESYIDGGAQSFPGLQPSNELDENRTNVGAYLGADWDATETFLVGAALRFENYSDFGSNFSWKVNARQLFGDNKGAIRASVSTGFRAPSLHQIYLSNIQTLVSGGTVSNQGTFNNVSPEIKALGVPALDAETSFNISAGVTYKVTDDFSISADYYNIKLEDRVLFTGEIGFDGDATTDNPVEVILKDIEVTSLKFFVNAMDTRTQGFDLVADYQNIAIGNGDLGFTLAMNTNTTEILGQINAPTVFSDAGYDIFNRKEQSRVTTARPNFKLLLGANVGFGNFKATLNNTYFGEVTWQHASNEAMDQTFGGRIVTDLILGYDVSESFNIGIKANNLLNVYPDVIDTKGDFVTDLGGRFKYPWEVNQFGFNGTTISGKLSFKF